MAIEIVKTILHSPSPLLVAGAYFVAEGGATGAGAWAASQDAPSSPCAYSVAMANAVAGDVIYWRGAVYTIDFTGANYETPAIRPANSGTFGNPITCIAYPGEQPWLNGNPSDPSMAVFGARDRQYIIWDGFYGTLAEEVNTAWLCVFIGTAVSTSNSYRCIVRNCRFYGSGVNTAGNNSAPIRMDLSLECEAYRNTISGNEGVATGINSCGIWLFTAQSCIIRNNEIYNCENGIMQKNPDNETNLIYRNFIHDIGTNGLNMNEQNAAGTGGSTIYDNLIINVGGYGIMFGDSYDVPNYTIRNNTMHNVGTGIGGYNSTNNWSTETFYDNIIHTVSTGFVQVWAAFPPTYMDYNCYSDSSLVWIEGLNTQHTTLASWQTYLGSPHETHSITSDPIFVNVGGVLTTDYALDTGSPCIGTGRYGGNMGVSDLSLVGVQ